MSKESERLTGRSKTGQTERQVNQLIDKMTDDGQISFTM